MQNPTESRAGGATDVLFVDGEDSSEMSELPDDVVRIPVECVSAELRWVYNT